MKTAQHAPSIKKVSSKNTEKQNKKVSRKWKSIVLAPKKRKEKRKKVKVTK